MQNKKCCCILYKIERRIALKNKILVLLSFLVLSSTVAYAYSKPVVTSDISAAIRLYKAKNYSECYTKLINYIKKDSSNALAYYYLGMASAQVGKADEAKENYERAMSLSNKGGSLWKYSNMGLQCLNDEAACKKGQYDDEDEAFIKNPSRNNFSDEARSTHERLKLDNVKREINRDEDITPARFKEFRDFSSMNDIQPTNDEIVAAIRILQKAGMADVMGSNYNSDLSMLMGLTNNNGNNYDSTSALYNMLGGNSKIDPKLIQSMLTNNMSIGF